MLNESEPPPFSVDDRAESDEPVRLKYRYVDLRRSRMQYNLRLRGRVNAAIRAAMVRQGFVEIETPLLWAPTPEGSREFSVPARLHHGSFYALPQSPQLAKQLLMVGGFDRYFQIARCLRDEDLRADRQFEFMQLDMECSFASQDDVMGYVSEAVLNAAEAATGRATAADSAHDLGRRARPLRHRQARPALRHGTGRPHGGLRGDRGQGVLVADGQGARRPRGRCVPTLAARRADGAGQEAGAAGLAWFRVTGDGRRRRRRRRPAAQLDGPLARHLSEDERVGVSEQTGARPGDLVLVVSDQYRTACEVLGTLRTMLGSPPVAQGPHHYVWVVDFPMFEGVGADGHLQAAHHPFTMPYPEDLDLLESEPLAVRSQAYDLVLNGWELGSGSVRIHRSDMQARVFAALGIGPEEAEARFGFLSGAFRYGAPPHAGFAFGVDRLAAILAGEENIREVIAYPKTQSGADPLTGAPKPLPAEALAELGIRVVVPPTIAAAGAANAATAATAAGTAGAPPGSSGEDEAPNPSPS